MLVFRQERKTGEPGEKSSDQGEKQQQTQHTYDAILGDPGANESLQERLFRRSCKLSFAPISPLYLFHFAPTIRPWVSEDGMTPGAGIELMGGECPGVSPLRQPCALGHTPFYSNAAWFSVDFFIIFLRT